MADSVKEKNMPTISSNVYGGLQKWVNRASVSLRGRRRSRNNSDASVLTRNQQNYLENMTSKPSKIVPVHGRSRSTPVDMPEDSSTFETFPQKIPQVIKMKNSERRRKYSSENSDDSSSRGSLHEAKDMSALNRRLSNNLSKSESSLLDGTRYSRRSKSLPKPSFGRRKSSLGQARNTDSNWSELDIKGHNKNSQSSQSLDKTNKKDKRHSGEHKANSIGINKSEKPSTIITSKNIHTRLDMWLEKTNDFKDSRQSSFESTSSSDELFCESKARPDETKHFRDLQTALDELVSSCGKGNMENKDHYTTQRKISLKNTGPMFNKTVDIDHSLQDERKTTYRTEKGGSSSDSGLSKETHLDDDNEEKYSMEERCDLESSYDSVDGFTDGHDRCKDVPSCKDSVSDIGPNMDTTRATNIRDDHGACNTTKDTSSLSVINGPTKIRQAPKTPKENINIDNKENLLRMADESIKNSPATIPLSHSTEKVSKNPQTVVFDDDLEAFALKCVEASKSLERDEKTSKSDSDDEKKTALDLDYVYIPKKTVKSRTHPETTSHKVSLPSNAFSDDEVYTSKSEVQSSYPKRNSQDSLDGLVLFEVPAKDIDFDNNESKYNSSNETDNTRETLKVDNGGYSLRKFPSMPLFYVPNDGTRKSRGKSLWKKLKGLPRSTDTRVPSPTIQKTEHSQPIQPTDPFYHGEDDQELGPKMRSKSNTMANGEAKKRNRRRRLSLEVRKSDPGSSNSPSENTRTDLHVMYDAAQKPMESQC